MTQNYYPPQQPPPASTRQANTRRPATPAGTGPPRRSRTGRAAWRSPRSLLARHPVLGGLLGVVLGIVGLIDAGKPGKKGKGIAVAAIVIGGLHLLLILPAIMLPRWGGRGAQANEVRASANLRQVGMAIQVDANSRRTGFAASLDELVTNGYVTSDVLTTPDGTRFVYVPPKWAKSMRDVRNASMLAIAYSPKGAARLREHRRPVRRRACRVR